MSIEAFVLRNGKIHQLTMDIDHVIGALEYTESGPKAAYKPAPVIKICISQPRKNLSMLNNEIGQDWPENKR